MLKMHICACAIEKAAWLWGPNDNRVSDSGHVKALKRPLDLTWDELWSFVRPATSCGCGTGGYSISRTFNGGLHNWLGHVRAALQRAQTLAHEGDAIAFVDRLSKQRLGQGMRPLGISAASKLVFFGAPNLRVFIYDSVVREAVGILPLGPGHYWTWHKLMKKIDGCATVDKKVFDQRCPQEIPEDWFRRRCLDQALYLIGKRIKNAANRSKSTNCNSIPSIRTASPRRSPVLPRTSSLGR